MNEVVRYPHYPIVYANTDNKFVLYAPYQVKNVRIPKGYKSDGLTLKSRLFRLVVSKYSPKFMPFFFIHDYLCDREKYKFADDLGEEILFDIEYSLRTRVMIKLVRLYHFVRYGVR